MEPELVTLPQRHYTGLGTNFISILSPDANAQQVIPELWHRFIGRLPELSHVVGDAHYGLCMTPPQRNHDDEFLYVACAEVSDISDLPEGMSTYTIEAGRYARFTHTGSLQSLAQTMQAIYGEWVPQSGIELRSSPDLEIYGPDFDPTGSPNSRMGIALPIH